MDTDWHKWLTSIWETSTLIILNTQKHTRTRLRKFFHIFHFIFISTKINIESINFHIKWWTNKTTLIFHISNSLMIITTCNFPLCHTSVDSFLFALGTHFFIHFSSWQKNINFPFTFHLMMEYQGLCASYLFEFVWAIFYCVLFLFAIFYSLEIPSHSIFFYFLQTFGDEIEFNEFIRVIVRLVYCFNWIFVYFDTFFLKI